jgi:predicted PurR-regulated permease PerM
VPTDLRGISLVVLAALATVVAARYAAELLIPIVFAVLIAYALNPVVAFLMRRRVPRPVAATLVLLVAVALLAAGGWALRAQALAVADQLPEAVRTLRERVESLRADGDTALQKIEETARELEKTAENVGGPDGRPRGTALPVRPEPAPFDLRRWLWAASLRLTGFGVQAAMVTFLIYFLLLSGDLYKRKLVRLAGRDPSRRRITVEILDDIAAQVGRFLLVRAATSAVVGVVTGVALWGMGLAQPAVWGVLAGVLNTIPYFGPVAATAGMAVVAFMQFGSFGQTALVAGVALAITGLEGWLLTPQLLGRASRMNPVAVFVGLLFWSWVWGIAGLILAVPMLAVLKALGDHVEALRPVSELLGDDEPAPRIDTRRAA